MEHSHPTGPPSRPMSGTLDSTWDLCRADEDLWYAAAAHDTVADRRAPWAVDYEEVE